jgi:hypothetical protein
MMVKLYFVLYVFCGLIICSCKSEKNTSQISIVPFKEKSAKKKNVILHPSHELSIQDNKQIQGDIELFYPISSDSAIIVDGSRNIHLLASDTILFSLTSYKGKGPGQYQSIKAIYYYCDTIFILDKSLKILAYSLSKKTFLSAYSLKINYLTATSFIGIENNSFLFMDGATYPHEVSYEQVNSSAVFQKLEADKQTKKLVLKKNDWPTINISRPVSMGIGNSIKRYGSFVVGWIGLSPYVSLVNLDSMKISLVELGNINIPLEQQSKKSDQDIEILSKVDIIQNIFALPQHFAVALQKVTMQDIIVQFYSYSGEFICEINMGKSSQNNIEDLTVVNVTDSSITMLGVNTNINSQTPHTILKKSYSWD